MYQRWATERLEEQAQAEGAADNAKLPTPDASQAVTDDNEPDTSGPSESSQFSQTATTATVPKEVYAVTLNLICGKEFDNLSREEAIALLKGLPLHIRFVPCDPAARDDADADASLTLDSPTVDRKGKGKGVTNGTAKHAGTYERVPQHTRRKSEESRSWSDLDVSMIIALLSPVGNWLTGGDHVKNLFLLLLLIFYLHQLIEGELHVQSSSMLLTVRQYRGNSTRVLVHTFPRA